MAYGIRERSAMIALAALGGQCSNAELKNVYRLDLEKKFRDKLNRDGLLESRKENRSFTHRLTGAGWRHVESEMSAEPPPQSGSAGGALFALLGGIRAASQRAGGLKALLTGQAAPATETPVAENLRDQIRRVYRSLAKRPQDWVMLSDLRPRLASSTKTDIDSILKRMFRDQEINLTLKDDQGSITQADRDAAIRVGPNDMHMLSIG